MYIQGFRSYKEYEAAVVAHAVRIGRRAGRIYFRRDGSIPVTGCPVAFKYATVGNVPMREAPSEMFVLTDCIEGPPHSGVAAWDLIDNAQSGRYANGIREDFAPLLAAFGYCEVNRYALDVKMPLL